MDTYYLMTIGIVGLACLIYVVAAHTVAMRKELTEVAKAIREAADKNANAGTQILKEEYVKLDFSVATSEGPISINARRGDHTVTIQPTGNGAIVTHEIWIKCETGYMTRAGRTDLKDRAKVTFIIDNNGTLLSFNLS